MKKKNDHPRHKHGGQVVPAVHIHSVIHTIRGEKVILDADLARVYGVSTRTLNQAVKRNAHRFPPDFLFQLTRQEWASFRSQIVTSNKAENRSQIVIGSQKHRDPRALPFAFTEHGAVMVANILKSHRAIQMSVFVVRAFIKLREAMTANKELMEKLRMLEEKLTRRLDSHEQAIVYVLAELRKLMEPPALPEPKAKPIGFRVQEPKTSYKVKRKT
jgi:hypothetical protein